VLTFAGFSNPNPTTEVSTSSTSSPSSVDAAVLASSTPAARAEGLRRASARLRSTSVSEIPREGDGRLVFRCGCGTKKGKKEEEKSAAAAAPAPPSDGEEVNTTTTSLFDVVRDGFLLGGAKGSPACCHRVAVCDFEEEEDDDGDDDDDSGDDDEEMKPAPSSPPSPPLLRVVAIVSQSDVVRFLARHPEVFRRQRSGGEGEKEQEKEEPTARDLASSPVAAVAAAMPASLALASLFQRQARVPAAAILGTRGELLGSLSASDLRGLNGGGAELRALGLPAGDFVEARARARAKRKEQEEEEMDDDGRETLLPPPSSPPSSSSFSAPPPVLSVSPDTPLSELVRLLAEGGHHRAFVVEQMETEGEEEEEKDGGGKATGAAAAAEGGGPGAKESKGKTKKMKRATGVISLSDVLRFVCKE